MDTMKLTLDIGDNLHNVFIRAIEAAVVMEKPEIVTATVNSLKELFIDVTADTCDDDEIIDDAVNAMPDDDGKFLLTEDD